MIALRAPRHKLQGSLGACSRFPFYDPVESIFISRLTQLVGDFDPEGERVVTQFSHGQWEVLWNISHSEPDFSNEILRYAVSHILHGL